MGKTPELVGGGEKPLRNSIAAKSKAIQRFLESNVLIEFFERRRICQLEDQIHLISVGINHLVKQADCRTDDERVGVINCLNNPQRILAAINHSGYADVYMYTKERKF